MTPVHGFARARIVRDASQRRELPRLGQFLSANPVTAVGGRHGNSSFTVGILAGSIPPSVAVIAAYFLVPLFTTDGQSFDRMAAT